MCAFSLAFSFFLFSFFLGKAGKSNEISKRNIP